MEPLQAVRANATQIQNLSQSNYDNGEAMTTLLVELIQTREVRQLLGTLIPEVLRIWAGNGHGTPGLRAAIKKLVSRQVGKSIRNGFLGDRDSVNARKFASLCEGPDFLQNFSDQLPVLLNGVVDVFCSIGKNIGKLPDEQKAQFLDNLFSKIGKGRTGELITIYTRIINEIHQSEPAFFAEKLAPAFRNWVEQADFGEIKELFDNSAGDIIALVKMANDVMWHYPAKVLLLLSLLPGIANIATVSLKDTLMRFNGLSPDLITDIVLSFLREIDGQKIGELINEVTELVRKLSTGSALLGEPGNPLFPQDMTRILEDALSTIDVELFGKARVAITEAKESVNNSIVQAFRNNPELIMLQLVGLSAPNNVRARAMRRKMELIEGLPEEEVADAISRGVSALDVQEMGEVLNLMALLGNRMRKLKPDLVSALVVQLVDSLDLSELQDTVKWLVDDLGAALKPLARVLVPQLVRGVCGWLTPEADENKEEVEMAIHEICTLLQNKEFRS
jgi:hypothetical protein